MDDEPDSANVKILDDGNYFIVNRKNNFQQVESLIVVQTRRCGPPQPPLSTVEMGATAPAYYMYSTVFYP